MKKITTRDKAKLVYFLLSMQLLSIHESSPIWAIILILANFGFSVYLMRNFPYKTLDEKINNFFK